MGQASSFIAGLNVHMNSTNVACNNKEHTSNSGASNRNVDHCGASLGPFLSLSDSFGDDGKPLNPCEKLSETGETKSYANLLNGESRLNGESSKKIVKFRTLIAPIGNGVDVAILIKFVLENVWRMFGLVHTMVNMKGSFFFKFSSNTGMDEMLESVPWLIRNVLFILRKWSYMANVSKEDLKSVLVLVKLHDDPLTGFVEDGLSVIAKKLGTPLMLNMCTASMCMESRGRF
ncbi:zinc knuckle CX2CX4HX4C containing protein [Tanacetum coccineum]